MNWYENPMVTSLLVPIVVAGITAWITNFMSRNKNKVEIDKLKEETSKLKKSFQPIVIGTLQSIQDKIIPFKIDALKAIVQLKNEFTFHEQQYDEGDPYTPREEAFLDLLFYGFSDLKFGAYQKFHAEYSYLFPDNVFAKLEELRNELSKLNETITTYNSIGDPDLPPGKESLRRIKKIIDCYDQAILAVRTDCHLDTSFIHDFIEQNK